MAQAKAKTKVKTSSGSKPSASERRAEQLAALERRAKRDPDRATAELAALIPTLRSQRERGRAAKLALALGTDAALDLALALFFDYTPLRIEKLAAATRDRLYARVVAQLPQLDLTSDTVLVELDVLGACEDVAIAAATRRALSLELLQRPDVPEHARLRATEALLAAGDPELAARIAADDNSLPFEVRARVMLASDPRGAYNRFVEDFRSSQERRDIVMRSLDDKADPRWIHEVLAIVSWHPPTITRVLARMRAADELADLAARAELDEIARSALHALAQIGDPRASQFLVEWLKLPAGQERAPMILTALGSCGDREAAAFLKTQLPHAGARAAFYQLAISEIEERLGQVPVAADQRAAPAWSRTKST